ncbi:UNVERIFIED_CONTAM: hypothetical protein PYX00_006082 [Menopon gallinae]|uniref:Lipase n=1 Tax=Menopon gallinae TaxID=328185 RepID=A0AAW2HTZ3_9NEOP
MKLLFLVLVIGSVSSTYIDENRPDSGAEWSDVGLGPVELITKYKYPAELHYVFTEDGYRLTVVRIPYGRMCPKEKSKGVVLLQHGIFTSCFNWVLTGTKRGLGYILADSCYDVWMTNSRGNSLSLGHVKYNTQQYEFWDFSWHEMGKYDHPAVFDYILNATGVPNITYVGHSQGTTSFLVFNILRPEYVNKVRAAFLLAPIAYLGHTRSFLLQILARFSKPIKAVADALKVYSILEQKDLISNLGAIYCSTFRPVNTFLCENMLFIAYGFDYEQTNLTYVAIQLKHELYGSSIKQLAHFGQLVSSKKFRQYDYGIKNIQHYGQLTPPEYDLSKANAPIHLYYAANDRLSDLADVTRLINELPNIKEQYLVPFDKFNHMDHIWADDIINLEYDHLVEEIDKYHNTQ